VPALIAAWCIACVGCSDARTPADPPYPIQTQVFLSRAYVVDQIYRSMMGPMKTVTLEIGEEGPPERIWIVSYKTEIVDADTGEKTTDEFMCHNNLDFKNLKRHQALLGSKTGGLTTRRLFTLSQGGMGVEFPQGFGIPVTSNEQFRQNTQVLNLNPIEEPRTVQYKTTVGYVRESDAKGRIRPLYQKGLQGMKVIKGRDGYVGLKNGSVEVHGEGCGIGEPVDRSAARRDGVGRIITGHWVVEPGHEENHTYSTARLGLKHDTTAHYVAVHLHPFAESLELRDLTTGETVFIAKATNSADRIGLEFVDSLSSEEGIPLYKDHEYTLISVYNNRSEERQDAMATMFIYMLDRNFEEASKQGS
jgi:hypothetical protein